MLQNPKRDTAINAVYCQREALDFYPREWRYAVLIFSGPEKENIEFLWSRGGGAMDVAWTRADPGTP